MDVSWNGLLHTGIFFLKAIAKMLGCTHAKVNQIINGKRGITPEFAIQLEHVLGTSAEIWVNLKAHPRSVGRQLGLQSTKVLLCPGGRLVRRPQRCWPRLRNGRIRVPSAYLLPVSARTLMQRRAKTRRSWSRSVVDRHVRLVSLAR